VYNRVVYIFLIPDSPKAPRTFTIVPVDKSNLKSIIETWKNKKTIYEVFLLYILGNKLVLLIEYAF
jgi:sugar phosphate permease